MSDQNEDPVLRVNVLLKVASGNFLALTTTDSSGNYSFSVLPGQEYIATIVPLAGYSSASMPTDIFSTRVGATYTFNGTLTLNATSSGTVWYDASAYNIKAPHHWMVWQMGLNFVAEIRQQNLGQKKSVSH